MKAEIPSATIANTNVEQVNVGEVKVGPVAVQRLVISDLNVQTSTGVAQMRGVSLSISMTFSLDWEIGITIPMPFGIPDVEFNESGTLDLGSMNLGITLGNLDLPGLSNLTFDIPSLPITDVSAVVGAIKNLNLGAVLAEQIRAREISAPSQGFQLDGIGINKISADGVTLPSVSVAGADVGRIQGGALPLTNIKIPNLALPQASIPRVRSQNVDASSNPIVASLPRVDIGLLAAKLKVTTTAGLHIDELRLDNIKASASIGEIALKDVTLPYEVLNVTLSQLGIETIEVPQLEVS